MRKIFFSALFLVALPIVHATSLKVYLGNLSYSFPADDTGVMNYKNGTTIQIAGNDIAISEIKEISVSEEDLDNNSVVIKYAGEEASVEIAGNLYGYVSAEINGAHVILTQSSEVSELTTGEITYSLSGDSDNGSFTFNGAYKSTIELRGITLTNPAGAAIDIQNGKRIELSAKNGTVNTLTDGYEGKQKAALYCKGHLELRGKGVLNVTGNTAHAISAKEYIEIKNCTVNIQGAVKDGINCSQYFLMESGVLTIAGTGDDGIQTDFKDSENREKEDTGTIIIEGGELDIKVTKDASKALKAEGDFVMSGGKLTALTSGNGIWDSSNIKTKASACVSADQNVYIKGGNMNLTSTGGGGKGISCDLSVYASGGDVTINTSGGLVAYVNGTLNQSYTGNADRLGANYKSSPKGIKCDGDGEFTGGTFDITTKGTNGEGIESKSNLTLDGDLVLKVRAYDDGTNSSDNTYIKGGTLDIMSTGEGDGVDANKNIYVSGGSMTIFGSRGAEQGFDAGDGYKLYITGGSILAYGQGGNSTPSAVSDSQAYLTVSLTPSAGNEVTVDINSETIGKFKIPQDYSQSSGGNNGPGGGGGPRFGMMPPPPFPSPSDPGLPPPVFFGGMRGEGPGGFGSSGILISLPAMEAGKSYKVTVGSSSSNATAKK